MNKILVLCAIFLICFTHASGQETSFEPISDEELNMKIYPTDSSANAVVLAEVGVSRLQNLEYTSVIFEYHVRIKILNSNGFDEGNITIPVYKTDNNRFESVSNISGFTTYRDVNGKLVSTELESKKVYKENKNKYWDLVKFAMPDLREGCIIEYKYRLESPYIFNFRSWQLQSDIPKVSTTYIAYIPSVYRYNVTLKGPYKLNSSDAKVDHQCFNAGSGVIADCSKMTYTMKDVPAFKEEDFMTAASNFMSSINFELSEYQDVRGIVHPVTKDWKDIDSELRKNPSFGVELRRKDQFEDVVKPQVASLKDDLSKAKSIFEHWQKWYRWNEFIGIYAENVKKAYERRSGSVADINLALVSALNTAGLTADAVLLSTRDNGTINKLYPVVSDFNYVIAKVDIDGKSYFLDASDPMLPFGLLPIKCINDQGRVISFDKPSYWTDLKASQKRSRTDAFDLTLDKSGKIRGTLANYSSGYEAYNKRVAIKKFNSTEEFVEDLDEKMLKMKILKSEIKGLDSLDSYVAEIYEVEIDAFDNLDQDKFLFSPVILNKLTENPFKLNERLYPVDWGAPSDFRYNLKLTFPENFTVVTQPPVKALALPNEGGRYQTTVSISGNTISFSQLLQMSKSIYSSSEYPSLKELFNRVIETQGADIIFERKL